MEGIPGLRALRASVLAGMVTLQDLEERLAAILCSENLCVKCAQRPGERKESGLCNPCHLRMLAEVHDQEQQAQRTLWTARQRKHRRRAG